jgi:signal peptidase II
MRPLRMRGFVIALAVAIVDQATKALAVARLEDQPAISAIPHILNFRFARNSGAAFSMGESFTLVFTLISTLVALGIIFFGGRSRGINSTLLSLVLGGVSGNLIDRFFRTPGFLHGHVVDWIELPHWPIFNIADSCVVVAALIYVLYSGKKRNA